MDPLMPTKFKRLYKKYKNREFRILDVGCGNHSASQTKKFFPNSRYYGVDKGIYNNSEKDMELMDGFYEVDLSNPDRLDDIPEKYDVVMFAHVIEHLLEGRLVLSKLCDKLSPNGQIYIEWPSVHSVYLPSMKGTLNFYDDPTHVRLYDVDDLACVMKNNGLRIIKSGIRKDKWRIFLAPYIIIKSFIKHKKFTSRGIWDLTGFASFIHAEKVTQ